MIRYHRIMEQHDSETSPLDPTLRSVLSQLSKQTGLSLTLVHPGAMSREDIEDAFDGIDPQSVEIMTGGEPALSTESNETLISVDRRIIRSVLSTIDPACHAWAAFFDPDGTHQISSSRKPLGAVS